jgi:hypothetical protein
MIIATYHRDHEGNLILDIPNIWAAKSKAARRSILANIRGRKLEVFVGMQQELWYFNTWKDAEYYDEKFGQRIIAVQPDDCVKWLQNYTPRGPDQENLLEYYSWHAPNYYWQQRRDRDDRILAAWESEQAESRMIFYQREQERLAAFLEDCYNPFKLTIQSISEEARLIDPNNLHSI